MIIGMGIDICENYRIREIVARYGELFLQRVFHEEEITYCLAKKDPVPHLSARFAVKEAFIKALSLRRTLNLSYREAHLIGGVGKKDLCLSGHLQELYLASGANRLMFSISHAREYSTAVVILEKI